MITVSKEDLISLGKRPVEEARKIQQMGGKARGQQIKDRAVLREAAAAILSAKVKNERYSKLIEELDMAKSSKTYAIAVVAALFKNILETGNAAGFDKLMRLMGEGDVKVDVTSEDNNLFQAIADSIKELGKAEDSKDDEV